jgi:hypothetical protein
MNKINMVLCKICFLVEGKDKLLNPKLDGLRMHVGKRKALIPHPRLLVGDYYINNDSQHQRNDKVHANQALESIAKLVVHGGKAKKKNKNYPVYNNFSSPKTWQAYT